MQTHQIQFPEALVRERARLQLSRAECANFIGVSTREIKRWEKGLAIPSVQQFERLAGRIPRLHPFPPSWAATGSAAVDGRLNEYREEMRRAVERQQDTLDTLKPPQQSFGAGLKRVREDNEVTRQELAEILGVTERAVQVWEEDEYSPVVINLEKLYDVLPELRVGIEVGAIRRPPSQDIPKPTGRTPGQVGAPKIEVVDASEESIQALALPSEGEQAEPPATVTQLAEAYGRSRLALVKARAAVDVARAALVATERALTDAEVNERELLELLDLAVADEATR